MLKDDKRQDNPLAGVPKRAFVLISFPKKIKERETRSVLVFRSPKKVKEGQSTTFF